MGNEMKMTQFILPTIFGAVLIGLTLYFHHKISVVNCKTDEILELITQQQRILFKHENALFNDDEDEEEEPQPQPQRSRPIPPGYKVVTPTVIKEGSYGPHDFNDFENVPTPSPEIRTPTKEPVIIMTTSSLDEALSKELGELQEELTNKIQECEEEDEEKKEESLIEECDDDNDSKFN